MPELWGMVTTWDMFTTDWCSCKGYTPILLIDHNIIVWQPISVMPTRRTTDIDTLPMTYTVSFNQLC